jgi:hypothetical protein
MHFFVWTRHRMAIASPYPATCVLEHVLLMGRRWQSDVGHHRPDTLVSKTYLDTEKREYIGTHTYIFQKSEQ